MYSHLIPGEDLEGVLKNASDSLKRFKNAHILITGSGGFFGKWFVATLLRADQAMDLGVHLYLLVRHTENWKVHHSDWAFKKNITVIEGDILKFNFSAPQLDFIIHLATSASAKLNEEDPLLMWETNVQGMRNVLEVARGHKKTKVLFTSSGAVYGVQPPHISHLKEEMGLGPVTTDVYSAYAEGKRSAEHLSSLYFKKYGVETFLARCFCFVGPHLPLDTHFAVGNFIRNALRDETIRIGGDGRAMRSYMYVTDLMTWLLKILHCGEPLRPYNVGSEEAVSIKELAETVAKFSGSSVSIAKKVEEGSPCHRYIPSTERARKELGLKLEVGLSEAIEKTIGWHRMQIVPSLPNQVGVHP